jgi:hypothetical protein
MIHSTSVLEGKIQCITILSTFMQKVAAFKCQNCNRREPFTIPPRNSP